MGIGVAMGTAIPEVKQAVDYFTLSCDQYGVAWWLEKKISEFKTKVLSSQGDGRKQEDFASFDLKIHNAIALNQNWAFTGYTPVGYKIDEAWLENYGLVNLISAKYPFNQPFVEFNLENIKKNGIWNVMPVFDGDHM